MSQFGRLELDLVSFLVPQITTPQQDIFLTISSVIEFEAFAFIQNCIATGLPTPTITWTSNTSTLDVVDGIISIRANHLNKNIKVNSFTCTASNYIGNASKSIEIVTSIRVFPVSKPIVDNKDTDSIGIQWLGDSQYTEYDLSYLICLRRTDSDDSDCIQEVSSTDTNYLFANLEDSTLYKITIVTITLFGRSPESDALEVETDPGVTVGKF